MNDKLYELLQALPKENLINIMWSALDTMQAFNGRTKMYCIMDAIGAIPHEQENGNYKYKIPTLKEIEKSTRVTGL